MTNEERAKKAVEEWAKKFFITFDDPLTGPGLADIIEKNFRELLEEKDEALDEQRKKASDLVPSYNQTPTEQSVFALGSGAIAEALIYVGDCLRDRRR